jgi:hypothetical protein
MGNNNAEERAELLLQRSKKYKSGLTKRKKLKLREDWEWDCSRSFVVAGDSRIICRYDNDRYTRSKPLSLLTRSTAELFFASVEQVDCYGAFRISSYSHLRLAKAFCSCGCHSKPIEGIGGHFVRQSFPRNYVWLLSTGVTSLELIDLGVREYRLLRY